MGLYARVFAVNAFILAVSVSLLAFTPISIDSATTAAQLVFLPRNLDAVRLVTFQMAKVAVSRQMFQEIAR